VRRATRPVRASLTITLILIVVLGVGLIGVSPLALSVFGGATGHWERLSYIGGTYGAASAILSVLAVIGVAVTLVQQGRESRAARLHAIRDNHNHLIEMAMGDPELNKVWGPGGLGDPFVDQRQSMYANMIVSQWQMSYETRSLTETHLRFLAREFFAGTIGREFWRVAREDRLSTSENRRIRRFHLILDEEYQASLATPAIPPPEPAPVASAHTGARHRISRVLLAGAAAAGVVALVRVIRRVRSPGT
jgi:hypothetical protein